MALFGVDRDLHRSVLAANARLNAENDALRARLAELGDTTHEATVLTDDRPTLGAVCDAIVGRTECPDCGDQLLDMYRRVQPRGDSMELLPTRVTCRTCRRDASGDLVPESWPFGALRSTEPGDEDVESSTAGPELTEERRPCRCGETEWNVIKSKRCDEVINTVTCARCYVDRADEFNRLAGDSPTDNDEEGVQ